MAPKKPPRDPEVIMPLREVLEEDIRTANLILANKGEYADKPQILHKFMELRRDATKELEAMGKQENADKRSSDTIERMRRKILDLENQLKVWKEKYGDVYGENPVDAGSLPDSRPIRAGSDTV